MGCFPIDPRGNKAKPQRPLPQRTATLRREHIARHCQQPWQRVLRNPVYPPPRDQKRLGHNVVDNIRRRSPPHIANHRSMVSTKQALQPLRAGIGIAPRLIKLAHHLPMADTPASVTQLAAHTPSRRSQLRHGPTHAARPSSNAGNWEVALTGSPSGHRHLRNPRRRPRSTGCGVKPRCFAVLAVRLRNVRSDGKLTRRLIGSPLSCATGLVCVHPSGLLAPGDR